MFKKIILIFYVFIMIFSFYSIKSQKDEISNVSKSQFNSYGNNLIKINNLEDIYFSNEINLYFSFNNIDNNLINYNYQGLFVNKYCLLDKIIVIKITILEINSFITINVSNGEFSQSSNIYFVNYEKNIYFSSLISLDDANLSILYYKLDNDLIDSTSFYSKNNLLNENKLFNKALSNVKIQTTQFSGTTPYAQDVIRIIGKIEWTDDNLINHPLIHAKVKISIDNEETEDFVTTQFDGTYEYWFTGINTTYTLYVSVIASSFDGKIIVAKNSTNSSIYETGYSGPIVISRGEIYQYDYNIKMDNAVSQSFQIMQAGLIGLEYAENLNRTLSSSLRKNITPVRYIYPTSAYDNPQYFSSTSRIYIPFQEKIISVDGSNRPECYAQWDALIHEYAHHIQKIFTISNNPGGKHSMDESYMMFLFYENNPDFGSDANYLKGIKLAWAEGWAHYFSNAAQCFFYERVMDIEFCADNMITGTILNKQYSLKSINLEGETCELAITQMLYRMSTSYYDIINSYEVSGDEVLFLIANLCIPESFEDFCQSLYGRNYSWINYNEFNAMISQFNLSSKNLYINYGGTIDTPPTYFWSKNYGKNICDLRFYDETGKLIIDFTRITSSQLKIDNEIWHKILNSTGATYTIYIYEMNYRTFSGYLSERFVFDKPGNSSQYPSETKYNISQDDYGFEQQYFFEEKVKNIQVNDLSLDTKRLRVGYISKEYIVMSPRRVDAGTAYLEYSFNKKISKIEVVLSLWSTDELLKPSNCTALIQYKNGNNWITILDLLNEIQLSTDRNNPDIYSVTFPMPIYEFRFYSTAPQIGASNNTGRLCIGNMTLN